MVRRVNVWFGAIFLTIGLVAATIGTIVLVTSAWQHLLDGDAKAQQAVWSVVAAPLGIGAAFSILGGVFVVLGLREARREARIFQTGTTTEGTVVDLERTGTRVNRRYLWKIRYAYDDLTGVSHEGKSGYLSAEDAHSYRVGEQAYVRYDPQQPSSSIWLGRDDLPP
jgi:hypothetical protein